jgi:hypothetical protein
MKSNASICCPVCKGGLVPVRLRCEACAVEVSGRFAGNEFATLGEDDLHFLRIFVVCEGRIRDMESALGVSYPTIKARLAKLKETLAASTPASAATTQAAASAAQTVEAPTAAVLKDLEAGRVTFDQAMARIRQIQNG